MASVTASLHQHNPQINATLKFRQEQKIIVATVWCLNDTFQFKHALSILSVIHTAKPDLFQIYYSIFPKSDSYNQWIQYVLVSFPFFKLYQCSNCCSGSETNINWVEKEIIAHKIKAIYIPINIIISMYGSDKTGNFNLFFQPPMVAYKDCLRVTKIQENDDRQSLCFNMEKVEHLIPTDIWKCTTDMCASIRYYMYHNIEPVKYTRHTLPVIPRIAHYIYYNKHTIDFSFYMSALSLLYIGNFSYIYVHSDQKMTGQNWNRLMQHQAAKEKVHVILRHNTCMVYGQNLNVIEHCADTGKIDVLYKYGGVVLDPDLMLVNELSSDLFHYDAVLNYDEVFTKPFPDRLNLGIIMARPESVFVKIFRESLRNFLDKKWLWNAGEVPYKILEYNPYLAKICHHLQVVVAANQYNPSWLMSNGFKHNITKLEEWLKVTQSFHYVYPSPFKDLDSVRAQEGMTGKVGRFILEKANLKRNVADNKGYMIC